MSYTRATSISVLAFWILSLLISTSIQAKLFARGGGETQTLTKITPLKVINTQPQTITLYGKFSKKQGKNRRVVIAPYSPPTPFPVKVKSWNKTRIMVIIPMAVQAGYYKIFLQKSSRNHGRIAWRDASRKELFMVIAAQSKLRKTRQDSICADKIRINFSGGPFKNGKRSLPISVETKAKSNSVFRTTKPTVKVISNDAIEVKVPSCFVLQKGASIRIIYPDGAKSKWFLIEERMRN